MLTSQVVSILQEMIRRRGDRHFTVQIHVNGRPVVECPVIEVVARKPSDGSPEINGTLGFNVQLRK